MLIFAPSLSLIEKMNTQEFETVQKMWKAKFELKILSRFWQRFDFSLGHPLDELIWDFIENFFGQHFLIPGVPANKLPELDKLNDVASGNVTSGSEKLLVRIELLHGREVLVADPDDDDRHGERWGSNDGVLGGLEIGDDAVGQNEKDEVLAAVLIGVCEPCDVFNDRRKICWTVEWDGLKSGVVSCEKAVDSGTVGSVWSKVEEKLVRDLTSWRNSGAETEGRKLLVGIVILKRKYKRMTNKYKKNWLSFNIIFYTT